jgi:hypothetical protein
MNTELIKKKASLPYNLKCFEFLNKCWKTCSIPDVWKEAVISPILKKGKRIECSNYRGISLLDSSYKIHAKLSNRVNILF